jgi:hypothetical protein
VDEPGTTPVALEHAAALLRAVKSIAGARTFVTLNGRGRDAAFLDPWVDVRAYQQLSFNPQEAARARKAGDAAWFYTGPLGSCAEARLNAGLWWFAASMDGQFYWHYCWPVGDPWHDPIGGSEYCAVFPSIEGPVATLAWEGVRQGLADLRYLRTLDAAIGRALKADPRDRVAAAAAARLKRWKGRLPADGADVLLARKRFPGIELERVRWSAALDLMRLSIRRGAPTDPTLGDFTSAYEAVLR